MAKETKTTKVVKSGAQPAPPTPINKARNMTLRRLPGQTEDQAIAAVALSPEMTNAMTTAGFTKAIFPGISLQECIEVLQADIKAVNDGDLDKLEGLLTAQAQTLNAMFNNFAMKAAHAELLPHLEGYCRLALKAQSQCRTTVEAIAEIKFPRSATFIKQANIAGQQQVNNGQAGIESHTRAGAPEKTINPTNELISEQDHATLDTAGAGAASRLDSGLEAVGTVNRTKERSRQARRIQ